MARFCDLRKATNEQVRVMTESLHPQEIEPLRPGSPFALGSATAPPTPASPPLRLPEPIGEGVWRETAAAAGYSTWMLVPFGIVGWSWFPAGGVAIALLGIVMSVMGMSSRLVKPSILAFAIHAILLVFCYTQSF
jgi:hypothetical protein